MTREATGWLVTLYFSGLVVVMTTCFFPLETSGALGMCSIPCPHPNQPRGAQIPLFYLLDASWVPESRAMGIIPGALTVFVKYLGESAKGKRGPVKRFGDLSARISLMGRNPFPLFSAAHIRSVFDKEKHCLCHVHSLLVDLFIPSFIQHILIVCLP